MPRPRVLVTGAAGFIGRWSVPPLLAAGYEVHAALTSTTFGRAIPRELQGAMLHRADLLEPQSADALIDAVRPSHLLHFAWIATPVVYWNSQENLRWLAASERLLALFGQSGGIRAVMAGSCAEYEWTRVGVCSEFESPLAGSAGQASTLYAQCKVAMQKALGEFAGSHGLTTAWGRIFFQYGPNEDPSRLVAYVINNLISDREALCSHGRQFRSFLHVADVGAAFAALMMSEVQGPVNIGSGTKTTIAEFLGEIARQIGRPELLKLGARSAPSVEPSLLLPDIQRLQGEVGWEPKYATVDGLADTIRWWRERLR